MKRFFKFFMLLLLLVFIVIQFFRPAKNTSTETHAADIGLKYSMPVEVKDILKRSCYDCHSNNTTYPWYAEIQPVAWWLDKHIQEGKKELNFSLFTSYSLRRQYRKLEEINEEIKEDKMPLFSYTFIHHGAKLNEQQKTMLANWADSTRNRLKTIYPADSFMAKKTGPIK